MTSALMTHSDQINKTRFDEHRMDTTHTTNAYDWMKPLASVNSYIYGQTTLDCCLRE
jgi:hypothetical protein